jgi:hypothetical protein
VTDVLSLFASLLRVVLGGVCVVNLSIGLGKWGAFRAVYGACMASAWSRVLYEKKGLNTIQAS